MRNVSSVLKRAIYQGNTERAFIILHTISHEDLTNPLRFTTDNQNTVSNGETYIPTPFRVAPPNDSSDIPSSTLEIDNTDRRIVEVIRSLTTSPEFTMWVVLDDDPNRIEAGPWRMKLSNARYGPVAVQMNVEGPSVLSEPFPSKTYNVADYPGLR